MLARAIHDRRSSPPRQGATVVEFALVMPVFVVFIFGIIEFGHAYMVIGTLRAAARNAATIGALDGKTTADVTAEANRVMASAFRHQHATILVKNAAVFDAAGVDPATINYAGLPNVEVDSLEAGQLFIVRIAVPYDQVAIMPPFWAKNITLSGQSVMRHE